MTKNIIKKYCECNPNKICGEAFTEYTCKECHKIEMYSHTCTPMYCLKCAEKLMVCNHCGLQENLLD